MVQLTPLIGSSEWLGETDEWLNLLLQTSQPLELEEAEKEKDRLLAGLTMGWETDAHACNTVVLL